MTERSSARTIFDWVAGIFLILLGIVGLFLPVLQGVLFILAGLALLSSHSERARRLRDWLVAAGKRAKDRLVKKDGS
jgi:uncharacterized membrane protein YbaN (DUF454 family)